MHTHRQSHSDDKGLKGAVAPRSVLLNPHPHAESTQPVLRQAKTKTNPGASHWNPDSRNIVAGTPHGNTHISHDDRQKDLEHHTPLENCC
jgi:hypothetical protein